MIIQYTSIDTVIGRVIRNTKLSDTSAFIDLPDWVADAMELLQTSTELEKCTAEVAVRFFQARIPVDIIELDAVERNGKRMGFTNANNYTQQESRESRAVKLGDLVTIGETGEDPQDKSMLYYIKPGYICTFFKEGTIKLHYKRYAVDDNGFPLIPDNGNYKEALYWFIRGKLIGSGQLEDRKNSEDKCLEYFERYAARAIGEITYPSVDQMERVRANQLQFNLPQGFWDKFNSL